MIRGRFRIMTTVQDVPTLGSWYRKSADFGIHKSAESQICESSGFQFVVVGVPVKIDCAAVIAEI